MKIQVNIISKSEAATHELVLKGDTVMTLKERVGTVTSVPTALYELVFKGTVLEDDQLLSANGVTEGSVLELVLRKAEPMLTQQFEELLQLRDLTPDELDLLYNYRYGITATQALQVLGYDVPLQEFIQQRKKFPIVDGFVKAAAEASPTTLQPVLEKLLVIISLTLVAPVSPVMEESAPLNLLVDCDETSASIKARAFAAELIPFPDSDLVSGNVVIADGQKISSMSIQYGARLDLIVRASEQTFIDQLSTLLQARPSSTHELSLRYSCRYGVSVTRAMRLIGQRDKFEEFIMRQTCFKVHRGCIFLQVEMESSDDEDRKD